MSALIDLIATVLIVLTVLLVGILPILATRHDPQSTSDQETDLQET
jgi:hypothetical protein